MALDLSCTYDLNLNGKRSKRATAHARTHPHIPMHPHTPSLAHPCWNARAPFFSRGGGDWSSFGDCDSQLIFLILPPTCLPIPYVSARCAANSKDIEEAIADVRNDDTDTNWYLHSSSSSHYLHRRPHPLHHPMRLLSSVSPTIGAVQTCAQHGVSTFAVHFLLVKISALPPPPIISCKTLCNERIIPNQPILTLVACRASPM
jgi:hypothetical protein